MPCADMFNHKTGANSVAVFGVEDEDADDANGSDEDADGASDSLVIKTVKEVKAGEELYNTFGEQSNASLLHKYGFCEEHNVDTATVTLDVSLFEDVFGEKTMHECYDVLKSNGELNEELIEFFEPTASITKSPPRVASSRISRRRARRQASAVSSRGGNPERSSDGERPTSRSFEAIRRFERFERGFTTRRIGGLARPARGVVGERAARLVRRQEVDLIYLITID